MSDLSFSFWEEALCDDVLQYMTDYVRLGQNSVLLQSEASPGDLLSYSNMFLRMLGSIYDNLKVADPIFLDGLICQPFYFGKQPNLSWIGKGTVDDLRKLIYNEERHKYLRTIRLLRLYSENVILINGLPSGTASYDTYLKPDGFFPLHFKGSPLIPNSFSDLLLMTIKEWAGGTCVTTEIFYWRHTSGD